MQSTSEKKKSQISITFRQSNKISEVKLDLEDKKLQKDIPQELFNYDLEDNISEIFREIEREEKVTGIEQSAKQEFDNLVKNLGKHEQHLSTFKKVKQNVISKWTTVKNALLKRTDNNSVPALKKEEKQNLKTMYQVFIKLQESKKNLFQKFKEFDMPIATKSEGRKETHDLQKTSKSLDWLGWERDFIMLEKNKGPYGGAFFNNWGSWENNPYANFYDTEDEFNRDIQFVNQMITKIDGQIRVLQGQMNWDTRRTQQLQSRISFFQNLKTTNYPQKHVVIKIAEKLLQHMGQLN
ncbi:hypothetical protein DNK47_03015 [Mycoplasma wenyonii]|uniref:Uncharacterized protein n=1 Tax=Mycoplasma wenyonii TaxID=65123 RepID=A0A328PK09_9MOLU|nr:hypothetical protein [Mycoplasma wenyonii]RAO94814.1 hypothetical protein DNK47_03015 [Mycoplasma wenyonii]